MSDRYLVWDGKTYDLTPRPAPTPIPPAPDPEPVPEPLPVRADTVRIGGATYPLAAVNPTASSNPAGAPFPGFRGPDQIIAVRAPLERVTTNRYGAAVVVGASGRVLAVRDDRPDASPKALPVTTPIPAGGLVLAGNGKGCDFLITNARQGGTVQLVQAGPAPKPPPVPVPGPTPTTGKTLAAYLMDGQGTVAGLPPEINQVRIAFVQGSPLRLVEWGGETPAQTGNGLQAWRAARVGPNAGAARTVLPSLGGQGGQVSLSDHAAFTAQFLGLLTKTPADGFPPGDGVDYDIEATPLAVLDAVTIEQTLAAQVPGWISSFVPSGGDPVPVYLRAAVQCHQLGLRVQYGQQFYDAAVSQQQVIGRVQEAINAGLPPSCILIGMMVGGDANHWTVDQCVANMQAIVAKWPDIGGAYVWESGRPGTGEWARRVGAVLGISA